MSRCLRRKRRFASMRMNWHTAKMKRTSLSSCGEWKNLRGSLRFIHPRSRGDPQYRTFLRFDRRRFKHMQAQTRKWIGSMILCTVFLLPGTRVTGQPPKTAQATIPFEFWIGDTLLPAGDYQIEHV